MLKYRLDIQADEINNKVFAMLVEKKFNISNLSLSP
jgi:hypothetical protein